MSLETEVCSSPPATPPRSIIKAATYHRLRVTAEAGTWLAEYYVDV